MGTIALKRAVAILLVILCAIGATAMEVHVSPSGDDAADGSASAPFASIEKARDAIGAARKAGNVKTTATILLHEGRYMIGRSLTFGKQDSGSEGAPLVVAGAPNERVLLFGGQDIQSDWIAPLSDESVRERIVDKAARDKVLTVDLGAHGISDYGEYKRRGFIAGSPWPPSQLYIRNKPMRPARWPNDDELQMAAVIDAGAKPSDKSSERRGPTFTIDSDRMRYWTRAQDAWLNGILSREWVWTFNKIASVDPARRAIVLEYPEVYTVKRESWIHDHFYFENLLEELDRPGEYYIDRTEGKLYFIPPEGYEEGTGIYLSMLAQPMIGVKQASHIVLRNIYLEGGRAGAVQIADCEDVRIERCDVRNFGADAIHINGKRCGVASSEIRHVGRRAVYLNGGDLDTLAPGGCYVENCLIEDFARFQRAYSPAVDFWGVGHRLSHSVIADGPHMAVNFRGNDHVIENCEIHHVVRDFDDIGAVYANLGERPLQRGFVIRGNYFHHIGHEGGRKRTGVYADNCSMGWLVERNLFYRIGSMENEICWSVMANGAAHVLVRNNIFVDCRVPMEVSFHLMHWNKSKVPDYMKKWREAITAPGFADSPHAKKYPELKDLLNEDRLMPDTNVFEKNLIYNPSLPLAHDTPWHVRYGPVTRLQRKDNWVANENPGFADIFEQDFRLAKPAAVRKHIPGFSLDVAAEAGLSGPIGPRGAK